MRAPDHAAELQRWIDARFEVLDLLGRGSFGEVHRVRDRRDGTLAALKRIRGVREVERLEREILAARQVDHPHVLRLLEAERRGSEACLLLELAEGSLEDRIRRPELLDSTLEHIAQACEGVAALHAAGLIHRDLKPANLLRVDGRVKVADFGLARLEGAVSLTHDGVIQGTPGYMAPEQARGEHPAPAWDVFSVGVLLYEAFEGRLPWSSRRAVELIVEIGRGQPLPPRRTPKALQPLLRELLSPRAEGRPTDLAEVARLLRRAEPTRPVSLTAPPSVTQSGHRRRSATLALPSTQRRRVTGSRRSRPGGGLTRAPWRVLVVLGLALVVGGAVGREGANRPPTSIREDRVPVGSPAPSPTNREVEALSRAVRDRLADLSALPPEPLRLPAGGLSDDPRDHQALLSRLPDLGPLLEAAVSSGPPFALAPGAREPLERTDALFEELGLGSPFRPFLELAPEPGATAWRRWSPVARRWRGRVAETLEGMERAFRRQLEEGIPSGVPDVLVSGGLSSAALYALRGHHKGLVSRLETSWRNGLHAEVLAVERWLGELAQALRWGQVALFRALHDPEDAAPAELAVLIEGLLAGVAHHLHREAAYPSVLYFGGHPRSPAQHYLFGVHELHRHGLPGSLPGDGEGLLQGARDHLLAAVDGGEGLPLPPRVLLSAFERLLHIDRFELEDPALLEADVQRLLRRLSALEDLDPLLQAHRFLERLASERREGAPRVARWSALLQRLRSRLSSPR